MKRIMSIFLVLTMMICLMLEVKAEQTEETYDLWVGGVQVTSGNLVIDNDDSTDITAGSATYDPDTKTLTLNNFSYTGQGYVYDSPWCAAIFAKNDLTVKVVGNNTVTASVTGSYTAEALNVWGALTITGDSGSSLTLTGAGRDGVGCGGNLKIENVTVNAKGTSGLYSDDGNITINNAKVTATATTDQMQYAAAIYAYEGNITIENSTVTANAPNANAVYSYYSSRCYTIINSNVTISAAEMGIGLTSNTRLSVKNSTLEITSDEGYAIVDDQNYSGNAPYFTGDHVVYAGADADSANVADPNLDTTYQNKYVKIMALENGILEQPTSANNYTFKVVGTPSYQWFEIVSETEHMILNDTDDQLSNPESGKSYYVTATYSNGAVLESEPVTIPVAEQPQQPVAPKSTVEFMVDGKVWRTYSVTKGSDIRMPEVPVKEGYVGKWDHSGENIRTATTITAVYTEVKEKTLEDYSKFDLDVYTNSRVTDIKSTPTGITVEGYMFKENTDLDKEDSIWREIIFVNEEDYSTAKAYRKQVTPVYNTWLNKNMNATGNGKYKLDYANYTVAFSTTNINSYVDNQPTTMAKGSYLAYMRISDGTNSYLFPLKDIVLSNGSTLELPIGFEVVDSTRALRYIVK